MIDLKLEDVQYLFSPTDYSRGMQYFRQGRVLNLKASVKDGIPQVVQLGGMLHIVRNA